MIRDRSGASGNTPAGLLICALLAVVTGVAACGPRTDQVCFDRRCFTVEVVASDPARQKGLQGRTALAADAGMLFVFPRADRYGFWMRETLIPLDMIWLDAGRRIVHIEHQVPPCTADPCAVYQPVSPALYVLEIAAGQAQAQGLTEGAQARFALDRYLKERP